MFETNRSSKNLPSLIDLAERDEFGIVVGGVDYEDKIVKKSPSKNLNRDTGYLTPETRLAFTKLKKVFTKASILQYFDLECYIWIEIDVSSYAITRVLN